MELCLSLRQRHTRSEPGRGVEIVGAVGRIGVDLEIGPHVRWIDELRRIEVAIEHADDDVRIAAE